VTGGTGGIGLEVARALAHANARVLLLSRSSENAEKAISEIKTSQENGQLLDVAFVQCDLGNLAHVAEIADRLRKEKRLDLVRAISSSDCVGLTYWCSFFAMLG